MGACRGVAYRLVPFTFGYVREIAHSNAAAWFKRSNKDYGP